MTELEHLAVNVMGWEIYDDAYWGKGEPNPDELKFEIYPSGESMHTHWNPREDIAQAHMLLDQFDDVVLYKYTTRALGVYWDVSIKDQKTVYADSLPHAIVDAVLQASNYHEK